MNDKRYCICWRKITYNQLNWLHNNAEDEYKIHAMNNYMTIEFNKKSDCKQFQKMFKNEQGLLNIQIYKDLALLRNHYMEI